ncbi:MAG: ATP-binding protein [Baekduia sp.]
MSGRRSLRLRLTVTYAAVFALGGALLLGAAYGIVVHAMPGPVRAEDLSATPASTLEPERTSADGAGVLGAAKGADTTSVLANVQAVQGRNRSASLRDVLWWFAVALGVTTAGSLAAGWYVAGRALAPVRRITAAARHISADRLDARLALSGPRDELRELGDTFDGMLDRLEHAFTAERRFVASASHELRTPLTLMRAEADVALANRAAPPAELREALASVQATADRGTALVSALLQMARSEQPLAAAEAVDLGALATDVVAKANQAAREGNVELVCTCARGPLVVSGDATLLRSLVENLTVNAITYNNHPDGWARVEVESGDGAVVLRVANAGPVVGADAVSGLFEPFARGEPSRSRRTGGAGLGLAIVRTVADAHGATVTARPGNNGGLVVTVAFRASAATLERQRA